MGRRHRFSSVGFCALFLHIYSMSYITAAFFELFVISRYSGSIQHTLACTIMYMHGSVDISPNGRVYSVTWGAICFLCAV